MNKKKKVVLSILGILLLIVATAGTSYAVFTYTKLGTTDNTVTSGILKFLYTENSGTGRGISITNAFPVSDEIGKSYATDNLVFDFKIEGTNTGIEEIPYEITLRKKSDSTLSEDAVKVYLTEKDGDKETSIVSPTKKDKKTVITKIISIGSQNCDKNNLNMLSSLALGSSFFPYFSNLSLASLLFKPSILVSKLLNTSSILLL